MPVVLPQVVGCSNALVLQKENRRLEMIPHFFGAGVPAFCDSTVNEGTHEAGRSLSRSDARRCLGHPNACHRLIPRDWAALVDDNPSVLTTKDFSEREIRTAPPKVTKRNARI